jgi:Zn-dependent protease
VLQAFGGYAAYSGARLSRPQGFAVTAAGPAVQILLGILVLLLLRRLPEVSPHGRLFLSDLMSISIFWALFNLLPILPLDGGRMLDSILGPERINITLWTTIIVASLLTILALKFTGSILMPVFMGMFAWQAWQALRENRRL